MPICLSVLFVFRLIAVIVFVVHLLRGNKPSRFVLRLSVTFSRLSPPFWPFPKGPFFVMH